MRHKKKGRKLNRTASHRKALMMNMALALISNKRIQTTDAKAKELRPYIERLISYAKKGDLHGRRLILRKLSGSSGKNAANVLIHEIAPACKDRNGGYARIIKLNNRKNDNAPVSLIELVDFAGASEVEPTPTEEKSEKTE
ncbi:MAG: 50S ribosomal protein L17 [Candidatus Marinimicrobia bacterium]|nr:50S ribosomal protein L17 [Candidatus Neomarinimicrobiota bacterium]MBL7023077.1 50S ribosomal protein L17 [Candidatus Neomarinimicrobiota bacterium]MBL7109097.1 50S ribosomal protein L17 [Candidatus Neomarinimicrobiota bacterium]